MPIIPLPGKIENISNRKEQNMASVGEALEERARMLEQTQWADEFSWKEIENFARYLNVKSVPKGMPVFSEGTRESYMCIVVSGSVRVIKHNVMNEERTLLTITRGKTFGEMGLFDGEPRSATILSAENTVLLVLTSENLERLMKDIPGLSVKLLFKLGKLLSQRLRLTSGKLVDFID